MTSSEQAIREAMARWSRALEAHDLDALLRDYAPDVTLFDIQPPYRIDGLAALRKVWEASLPCLPRTFRSTHREVAITVADNLAFVHCLHGLVPLDADGQPGGARWLRATLCFAKRGGRWLTTHEHVSIPFDPATGQVAPIGDADIGKAPA